MRSERIGGVLFEDQGRGGVNGAEDDCIIVEYV